MAQIIQIIDKRIAKFSTKGSPLKTNFSQKESRNVKLKPIEITVKGKNEMGSIPTTQKVRRIKMNAANHFKPEDTNEEIESNTVEFSQSPIVLEHLNHSESFEAYEQSPLEDPKEDPESKQQHKEKEEPINDSEEKEDNSEEIPSKFQFSDDEIQSIWTRFKLIKKTVPFRERYHWVLYRIWRTVCRRGVRQIAKNWRKRVKNAVLIQKTWKMFKVQQDFTNKKTAAETLQHYWKSVSKPKKMLKAARTIALLLSPIYRLRFIKRTKAATQIQKLIRGRRIYQSYRPLITQKLKILQHKTMLERQATLKKARNAKKIAIRLIEDQWLSYQARKKLVDVRKYLWTLPYECRLLYFKFQQVKKDADNLKTDVDLLIAKKQGKISV